jgi:hypothetical protein
VALFKFKNHIKKKKKRWQLRWWPELQFHLKLGWAGKESAFRAHLVCWQYSFPYSCRIPGFSFFLYLRPFLLTWSFTSSSQQRRANLLAGQALWPHVT